MKPAHKVDWTDLPFEDDVPAEQGTVLSWAERAERDEDLRQFIAGEIVRAGIEVDSARYNEQHWRSVANAQAEKVAVLETRVREFEEASKKRVVADPLFRAGAQRG
jgi:hypothetical protein